MNKFKIDEDYGKEQESKSEEYIKDYFKQSTLKKLSKFNKFDFEGDTALFEVKSRRNNHDAYPSTMIGYNKILACKKCEIDVFFIFQYLDGNYYYKYSKDDSFEIKKGGRYDRGKIESNYYCFIPIEKLIKIDLN
jgi:hypothetical protein